MTEANNHKAGSKQKLIWNAAVLYGVQGCTYVLPLVTIPYLARVLKPDGWGAVLFSQSIGAIIAICVEYGFDFSATRETARSSGDKRLLRELISGVLGAKLLLAVVGVAGAVVARPYIMRVAPSPGLFWASTVWGVAQGINMLWYFQGLQRMGWAGGLDITGKVIATLSIFVFVHRPEDGWKVMAAQAAGCAVSHMITVGIAYYETGFSWPTGPLVGRALRVGWSMFLYRAAQSLTSANALILGFFGTPAAVGLFMSSDKIRQAAVQAIWPINQTLFPHQSQLIKENPRAALKMVRRSLAILGGVSAVFGLILSLVAPLLVRVFLGTAFLPAVPILRIFGLLIPLQALCVVLSFQWMLPLGFDRQFNFVVFTSGIITVCLGILLTPRMGGLGMAIAVTVAQVYSLIAVHVALRRNRLSPFSLTTLRDRPTIEEDASELIKHG